MAAPPPGGPTGTDLPHGAAASRARSPHRPRKPISRAPRDKRDVTNNDNILRCVLRRPHFNLAHFTSLGNFNVLNLINPNVTYYGKNHYTPAQVDRKIEWIAHQLRNMKAGVSLSPSLQFPKIHHGTDIAR